MLKKPSNVEFTYIGRYNREYKPTKTRIIQPTHGIDLGNSLRENDIYITASRFEPCGMHHIEGSACGLPVLYHEDGGGINELCKKHGESFRDMDQFFKKLNHLADNYEEYLDKIKHGHYENGNLDCSIFDLSVSILMTLKT